jgi:hypothetical protein
MSSINDDLDDATPGSPPGGGPVRDEEGAPGAGPARDGVDLRESLANDGLVGSIAEVSIPAERITSLRGLMVDLDPHLLRRADSDFRGDPDPRSFLRNVSPALERHPVLCDAEVRSTGTGLHLVVQLGPRVELATAADQTRWAALVRLVQFSLPSDPNAPGITGLTRPVGSVNSKNGATVELLRAGRPVDPARVVAFAASLEEAPFRTVAAILHGPDRISPCPVCRGPGSSLGVGERSGVCYSCGKVGLERLFDAAYAADPGGPAAARGRGAPR